MQFKKRLEKEVSDKLLLNTANAYFEYGILGISVVVLLVVSAVLLFSILKDKKHQTDLSEAITKTSNNQKEFIIMYQDSQKQHKEIVQILNETLEIERANTKECYIGVGNKIDKMALNQERLLDLIKMK